MKNLICLINSYLAFFIFHLFFLHFSMTTLLQLGVSALKNCIYRAMELSKCRKASLEVSKFGFHFLAVIRIALENRRVVHSKAHFVPFKSVMSIFFGSEYSFTYLLFILSSIRSISIEKEQFIKPKGW